MAGIFFRLKLQLIRNGLRGSDLRAVAFVIGALFGLGLGIAGFSYLALPPEDAALRALLPVGVFVVLFAGWVVIPILGFGIDETLDPDRLTLLPLSRGQLMGGLFVASCTGIAPAATLLALGGAVLGYTRSLRGVPVALVVVATEFALCLVAARATTTALSRALRSRRARDVWIVLVSLLALGLNAALQSLRFLGPSVSRPTRVHLTKVLGWLPPGRLGLALEDAGGGRLGAAIQELLPGLALLALMAWWWTANLDRLATTPETAGPRSRRVASRSSASVPSAFPRFLGFLPRDRFGAVAGKDVRYLWREPTQRVQRVMSGILSIVGIAVVAGVPSVRRPEAVLLSVGMAWWFGLAQTMGQFGYDRGAFWMNAVAPGDPADDLRGKNAALVLVHGPFFLLLAVVLASITGGWAYLPLAACLGIGSLGLTLGVGNVTSVRLAIPAPESRTNLWANRSGQGCGTGLVLFLSLLLVQVLMVPMAVLVAVGLLAWSPLLIVAAPFSVVYGVALYLAGYRSAVQRLRTHQPELLEQLSPRQAA